MSSNENLKNIEYRDNQGKFIYEEYLQAIKLKISQILLYDSETAMDFLSDYNEIINNKSKKIMEIIDMVNSLEQKISDYEKEKGSKIELNEQLQILYDMIDELDRESDLLSLDDCLEAFSNIRKRSMEIDYKDFQERDFFSTKIYKLQADLISKAVREKSDIGLEDLIQKDDEKGLKIAINQKIDELSQSQDVGEKNRAQKMRNIMLTDQDCVHSMQLWQLMNGTEYEIVRNNQDLSETKVLPVVYNKRNPETMIMSLIKRFLELFKREQTTGIQLSDLAKIDMEWLAEQIEKNPYILEDNERLKLEREGRKNVDKIFIPDAKTPIYDFFEGKYDNPVRVKHHNDHISKDYEYDYTDDNGLEKKLIVSDIYDDEFSDEFYYEKDYSFICGEAKKNNRFYSDVHLAIEYVQFIDKILGTDLTKKMLCELEECEMREGVIFENEFIYYKGKRWKILDKILKNYYKMKEECEKTNLNFRGKEEKRRNTFYMKHSFFSRIEMHEAPDAEIIGELVKGSKKMLKKKKQTEKKKKVEEEKYIKGKDEH